MANNWPEAQKDAFADFNEFRRIILMKQQRAQYLLSKIEEKRLKYKNPKPSHTARLERRLFSVMRDLAMDLGDKALVFRKDSAYVKIKEFGNLTKNGNKPTLDQLDSYLKLFREFEESMKIMSLGEHKTPANFIEEMAEGRESV